MFNKNLTLRLIIREMLSAKHNDFLQEASEKYEPSSAATVILDKNRKALILRRGPTAPWMPGKWSLPGGTVDKGESTMKAAKRETSEETTLKIGKISPLAVIPYEKERWSAAFFIVMPGEWSGEVELIETHGILENDKYEWISEDEIDKYSFIPTVKKALKMAFQKLKMTMVDTRSKTAGQASRLE